MTITPDSLRRNLADLASSSAHAGRSADEIHKAAEERRAVVMARLDELRPKTFSSHDASLEYSELIEERGRLDVVLGGGS